MKRNKGERVLEIKKNQDKEIELKEELDKLQADEEKKLQFLFGTSLYEITSR